jgi:hypothetical protein
MLDGDLGLSSLRPPGVSLTHPQGGRAEKNLRVERSEPRRDRHPWSSAGHPKRGLLKIPGVVSAILAWLIHLAWCILQKKVPWTLTNTTKSYNSNQHHTIHGLTTLTPRHTPTEHLMEHSTCSMATSSEFSTTEWFILHLQYVDTIASVVHLSTHVVTVLDVQLSFHEKLVEYVNTTPSEIASLPWGFLSQ